MTTEDEILFIPQYYVYADGKQAGGFVGPHDVPEHSIEVFEPPLRADQVWQFPGWSESSSLRSELDAEWKLQELGEIAKQLERIEEGEAGVDVTGLLPGTRKQWLAYRGLVRNWAEGKGDYPDMTKRPKRPF